MDLLVLFATSDGRLIGKDEIIASVWNGRAVGDDTLAAAISRLRSALGADAENRYIETLPKRGYRLAAFTQSAESGEARAAAQPAAPEAMQLVAQGAAMLAAGAPTALPQARLYFERAIGLDPRSAEAQAGLAETLFAQHLMGQAPPRVLLPLARAAAFAAVGLDENLAQGWTLQGYAALIVDRDFAAADRALLRAIALAPGKAAPRRYRAVALASVGRMVEAERESRAAVELEPLSLAGRARLLQILLAARRFRQVLSEAETMIALSPTAGEAWYSKGWALAMLDREGDGVAALLHGLSLWGLGEPVLTPLASLYERQGFRALCAAVADLLEQPRAMFAPRSTDIAALRAAAGQADPAFAALEAAIAGDDPFLLLLEQLPFFDALNNDPRWRPLVRKARRVR